jgi:ribosomal protein S2
MSNIEKIIEAKLYLGDLKKRSNPKTRDYWLDVKNGVVLFDPEIISKQLDFAKAKIAELKKE